MSLTIYLVPDTTYLSDPAPNNTLHHYPDRGPNTARGASRPSTSKTSGRGGILGYNFLLGGTPLLSNLKNFSGCTPLKSSQV